VGNAGFNYDNNDPFTAGGPASHLYSIGVGGVTSAEYFWALSSEGPSRQRLMKPDLMAQSSFVLGADSTTGGLISSHGTSLASPLVAGGIAAIIQQLRINDLPYDPGMIRSQLFKHARFPVNASEDPSMFIKEEYSIGRGIPNFSATLNDWIVNGSTHIEITPSSNPYGFHKFHHRNNTQPLDAVVFSSVNPSSLTFQISGNISSILQITKNIEQSIEKIPINIVSDPSTPFGNYTGTIFINSTESDAVGILSISISIIMDRTATVLLDGRYTSFDELGWDGIHGTQLTTAVETLWMDGFYFLENFDNLELVDLSSIDILWLADFQPFVEVPGGDFVIDDLGDALSQFIDSGGKVFVHYNGRVGGSPLGNHELFYFKEYNIKSPDPWLSDREIPGTYLFENDPWYKPHLNETSAASNTGELLHWGNFIQMVDQFNPSTYGVFGDDHFNNLTMIFSESLSHGKIAASSSFAWIYDCKNDHNLETCEDYYPWGAFDHITRNLNKDVLLDVFNWLIDPTIMLLERPTLLGESFTHNFYSSNGAFKAHLLSIDGDPNRGGAFSLVDLGNDYFRSDDFTAEDGMYEYELSLGDEFIRKILFIDFYAPTIVYEELDSSMLSIQPLDYSFIIHERFIDEITVELDLKSEIIELEYTMTNVSTIIHEMDITIPQLNIANNYRLLISVLDTSGRLVELEITFNAPWADTPSDTVTSSTSLDTPSDTVTSSTSLDTPSDTVTSTTSLDTPSDTVTSSTWFETSTFETEITSSFISEASSSVFSETTTEQLTITSSDLMSELSSDETSPSSNSDTNYLSFSMISVFVSIRVIKRKNL